MCRAPGRYLVQEDVLLCGVDCGPNDTQAGARRNCEGTGEAGADPALALLVAVISVLLALALGTGLFLLLPAAA